MRTTRRTVYALLAGLALAAAALPAGGPAAATTPTATAAVADTQQVFAVINAERRWHGLPALRWNWRLAAAARGHDRWMAAENALSHRLAGEASFGARFTAAGYQWRAAGENLAVTTDWSLTGILYVHRRMYHEVAPNDAHRRIILSPSFRDVGIGIIMDAVHHKAWLTEDFAAPL